MSEFEHSTERSRFESKTTVATWLQNASWLFALVYCVGTTATRVFESMTQVPAVSEESLFTLRPLLLGSVSLLFVGLFTWGLARAWWADLQARPAAPDAASESTANSKPSASLRLRTGVASLALPVLVMAGTFSFVLSPDVISLHPWVLMLPLGLATLLLVIVRFVKPPESGSGLTKAISELAGLHEEDLRMRVRLVAISSLLAVISGALLYPLVSASFGGGAGTQVRLKTTGPAGAVEYSVVRLIRESGDYLLVTNSKVGVFPRDYRLISRDRVLEIARDSAILPDKRSDAPPSPTSAPPGPLIQRP